MTSKINILVFVVCMSIIATPAIGREFSLLKHASISGQSSHMINGIDTVTASAGSGIKGSINLSLSKNFGLEFGVGYLSMKIDQNSAVNQWNWSYYDSVYANKLYYYIQSGEYDIEQHPQQQITIIPFEVALNYSVSLSKAIEPYILGGVGIFSYKRNLWLDETWGEGYKLPQDSIYYEYRFNHYAPPKKGAIPYLRLGAGVNFTLMQYLSLGVDYELNHIPFRKGSISYRVYDILFTENYYRQIDNFPFDDIGKITLSLNFNY